MLTKKRLLEIGMDLEAIVLRVKKLAGEREAGILDAIKADMADDPYWTRIIDAAEMGTGFETVARKDEMFSVIKSLALTGQSIDLGDHTKEQLHARNAAHQVALDSVLRSLRWAVAELDHGARPVAPPRELAALTAA